MKLLQRSKPRQQRLMERLNTPNDIPMSTVFINIEDSLRKNTKESEVENLESSSKDESDKDDEIEDENDKDEEIHVEFPTPSVQQRTRILKESISRLNCKIFPALVLRGKIKPLLLLTRVNHGLI